MSSGVATAGLCVHSTWRTRTVAYSTDRRSAQKVQRYPEACIYMQASRYQQQQRRAVRRNMQRRAGPGRTKRAYGPAAAAAKEAELRTGSLFPVAAINLQG
jgi:hypothetical protein